MCRPPIGTFASQISIKAQETIAIRGLFNKLKGGLRSGGGFRSRDPAIVRSAERRQLILIPTRDCKQHRAHIIWKDIVKSI